MPDETRMSSVADRIADRVIARIEDCASNLHSAAVASAGECERLRGQVAEQDRRIEDLRVGLIRAINTALSRAGVELPTSAAATVEPVPPKYTTVAECLHVDNLEASAAATAEPSVTGEVPLSFRLMVERDAARAEVKALEDWRADVTVALQRPGGALFADVPKHVRDLVGERDDLKRQLYAGQPRIETPCPACGGNTLFVEPHFDSTLAQIAGLETERDHFRRAAQQARDERDALAVKQRDAARAHVRDLVGERDDLKCKLVEATEWRPMATAPLGEPIMVRSMGPVAHVFTTDHPNFWIEQCVGWLPIPPYRVKEEE